MLLFDIEKVFRKYSPKNKYFFASFSNDRGVSLDDQTKIMPTEIPRSSKFVTWGHTTRVTFRVKICIFERSNENYHFSKAKIYFHKKTTPQLLGHIRLQKMKVGDKTNSGDLPLFVWCMLTLALNTNNGWNQELRLLSFRKKN